MAANKSFVDKKTNLETKRQQLAEKLARLQAAEKERQRKQENAQRLLVGRVALAYAKTNTDFARLLFGILDAAVTRPDERKIIADLLTGGGDTAKADQAEAAEVVAKPEGDNAGSTPEA